MMNSIHSFVRLKPAANKSIPSPWEIPSSSVLLYVPDKKHYCFDKVFGGNSSTSKIFNEALIPSLQDALLGKNLSVLAYGCKKSGKTFTMHGTKLYPGVIPLTIEYLFEYISKHPGEYLFSCVCFEVYKDVVKDLFTGVIIGSPEVKDLRKRICISGKQVKKLVKFASKLKKDDSHFLYFISRFSLTLESLRPDLAVSTISFFDFAGIDCDSSLKSLEIIRAVLLQSPSHSKLGEFLAKYLDANVIFICPVSPAFNQLTSHTFRFLERLKSIEFHSQQVPPSSTLIELKQRLEFLKVEIDSSPENDSLIGEYESIENMIIISESGSRNSEAFEIASERSIQKIEHVEVNNILNRNSNHKFNFEIINDPVVQLPHEEWARLIVDQDGKVEELRQKLARVNEENCELQENLKQLKQELTDVKFKVLSFG